MSSLTDRWNQLAGRFEILLPERFLDILELKPHSGFQWRFLDPDEARQLMAELDLRYNYPDREWRGIPFARSTVSEDIVCFDLQTQPDREAKVIPIRDWHGPRWEFSGGTKTFAQWLMHDAKGHLT